MLDLLSDPARFPTLTRYPARDYPIGPGRYLMLGDNSPWSRDGRAWGSSDQIDPDLPGQGWDNSGRQSWEVPEALLIGKAFCVYWPHPKPVWPRLRFDRGHPLANSSVYRTDAMDPLKSNGRLFVATNHEPQDTFSQGS